MKLPPAHALHQEAGTYKMQQRLRQLKAVAASFFAIQRLRSASLQSFLAFALRLHLWPHHHHQ